MDLNYYGTLIAVAGDCPVERATVPPDRGSVKTIATVQYQLLAGQPYRYTQEDVLFESWLQRQNLPGPTVAARASLRHAFFSKPQACLRASPLPKKYGWGLHFDEKGRVALCPVESAEYQRLLADPAVTVLKAMRSKRA